MSDGFRGFKWGQQPASEIGKASPLEAAIPKPAWAPLAAPLPPPLKRDFRGDRLYLIDAQIARAVADELYERGLTHNRFSAILLTTQRHVRQMITDGKIKMPMLARLCQVFGWKLEIRDAQNRLILAYPHDTAVPARRDVPEARIPPQAP